MFIYEKKLEFPVKIKQTNPKLAGLIISQFGGADCPWLYFFIYKKSLPFSRGRLYLFC